MCCFRSFFPVCKSARLCFLISCITGSAYRMRARQGPETASPQVCCHVYYYWNGASSDPWYLYYEHYAGRENFMWNKKATINQHRKNDEKLVLHHCEESGYFYFGVRSKPDECFARVVFSEEKTIAFNDHKKWVNHTKNGNCQECLKFQKKTENGVINFYTGPDNKTYWLDSDDSGDLGPEPARLSDDDSDAEDVILEEVKCA
eukprot:TRINITY_DN24152_c0_g1_i1.p1 TRINITY_DN24152_c0_g1~~TRINITY_DN24152_c0_g1_i1.p1  ORF type:complete len:203 (-),score=13.73 TRINITY_DN24152_c0_g1_i1:158-766(-)